MRVVGNFFDRIAELIWANEKFKCKLRRLLVNWNPSQLPLCDCNGSEYSVFALHSDFRSAKELSAKGCTHLQDNDSFFDKLLWSASPIDLCIIGASRCYEQNLLFFRLVSEVVRPGGIVCVVAPNMFGARRLEKEFSRYWDNVETESKFHGRYFWSTTPQYEAQSVLVQWRNDSSSWFLEPGGFITDPGNFSWKSCDSGSEFLIDTLREGGHLLSLKGTGADLGAGYGFLSKMLLDSGNVDRILLLESDKWALNNAKKNIINPNARFIWCDISVLGSAREDHVDGLERNLKWVIMNPPFHDLSGDVSIELGLSFFRAAHSLLCPGGQLYWVANGHLPYLPEVAKVFRKVSVLGRNSQFLVGRAEK